MKWSDLHKKVMFAPHSSWGWGSLFKVILLGIVWNVQICTENHVCQHMPQYGWEANCRIFSLGITWNIQICTEKSSLSTSSPWVWGGRSSCRNYHPQKRVERDGFCKQIWTFFIKFLMQFLAKNFFSSLSPTPHPPHGGVEDWKRWFTVQIWTFHWIFKKNCFCIIPLQPYAPHGGRDH